MALDWKWLFIYPDQRVAAVNQLVIPAGRPIHISLTSGTVMQALLIPQLAGQIYAMAGMTTQLNLAAIAPGRLSRREHAVQRRRLPEREIQRDRAARRRRTTAGWRSVRAARRIRVDAARAPAGLFRRSRRRRNRSSFRRVPPRSVSAHPRPVAGAAEDDTGHLARGAGPLRAGTRCRSCAPGRPDRQRDHRRRRRRRWWSSALSRSSR